MKAMTMAEIKDAADMAETWPGSGVLNWGEVGWEALTAWVTLSVEIGGDAGLPSCDVESVKGCFERWWKTANAPHQARAIASRPECSCSASGYDPECKWEGHHHA